MFYVLVLALKVIFCLISNKCGVTFENKTFNGSPSSNRLPEMKKNIDKFPGQKVT